MGVLYCDECCEEKVIDCMICTQCQMKYEGVFQEQVKCLHTRNAELEKELVRVRGQRDGLAEACNHVNESRKRGSWSGCLECDRNDCSRSVGCLDMKKAHVDKDLRPVIPILQEIAQEQEQETKERG